MGLDHDARKPDFGAWEQQRRRLISLISPFIYRLLESIISELAYCKISFLACRCS